MDEIKVRHAETDHDVLEIHQFLCIVSGPQRHGCPIDAQKSVTEVNRVVKEHIALIATMNDHMVGTMGLLFTSWWWGNDRFITDRWLFIIPDMINLGIGAALLGNAAAIAASNDIDLVVNGRPKRRGTSVGRGLLFTTPRVIRPGEHVDFKKVEHEVLH